MATTDKELVVDVEERSERGKNANRRLRAQEKIPANVYGMNLDSYAVSVNPRRVEEILRTASGRNTIFKLSLGGRSSRAVMLREIQRDPLSEQLVHVDFVRVDETKVVTVKVPIQLVGTPLGVKNEGGVLDFVHRNVEVTCLPSAIPEHFDVDVSHLHTNQNVAVKDLVALPGVEIEEDPETIIAVVAEPRMEEEPEVAEEVEGEEAAAAEEGEEKAEEGEEQQKKKEESGD
jgi:large subunit ribosomal protein L25